MNLPDIEKVKEYANREVEQDKIFQDLLALELSNDYLMAAHAALVQESSAANLRLNHAVYELVVAEMKLSILSKKLAKIEEEKQFHEMIQKAINEGRERAKNEKHSDNIN